VGSGSQTAKPAEPRGTPPTRVKRTASPYNQLIQANKPKINACAQQHGAPPGDTRVVIVVSPSGKPKTVSLEPAALSSTPLGTCIKNVLSVVTFPTGKSEMQVAVSLSLKSS